MLNARVQRQLTKQLSSLEQVIAVKQMLKNGQYSLFTIKGWFQCYSWFSCITFCLLQSLGSFKILHVYSLSTTNSLKPVWSERSLHFTVLQWPCNAIFYAGPSGELLYTIRFYCAEGTSTALFLLACCGKHGSEVVMTLSLLLKVTCAHVCSLYCAVTSWPDSVTSTLNFMNHAPWTHTARHLTHPVLPLLRLIWSRLAFFIKILQ